MQLSNNVHVIPLPSGRFFIFHSLRKNPLVVERPVIEFLEAFRRGRTADAASSAPIKDVQKWQAYYCDKGFLVQDPTKEKSFAETATDALRAHLESQPLFPAIGFTTGTACNFDCTYCMSNRMASISDAAARYAVDFQAERAIAVLRGHCESLLANGQTETSVGFSGGEPLLYWPKIRRVIAFCHQEYANRMKIRIHINTNASLVTTEMANFMKRHDVLPSVSLDGYSAALNDVVRIHKTGRGSTFAPILRGIARLRKAGLVVGGVYITLTERNFAIDANRLVAFLRKHKFTSVTIEPDLLGVRLPIEDVVRKLMEVETACVATGLRLVGFWKRPYENLTTRRGIPHDLAFCEALRGGIVAVDNSGRLRVCAYSDRELGDESELADVRRRPAYYDLLRDSLVGNISACQGCEIEGPCRGGCYLTREYVVKTGDDSAFKTRCELYRLATRELIRLHHE